jgi:glutathione peroxidase
MFRNLLLTALVATASSAASNVHDFTMESIDGKTMPLSTYKGKVLLIVNVASKCGYTSQYAGLQSLYQQYKDKGLVVLGVPANNFGGQEPGNEAEIKEFCSRNYSVTFPMTKKVSVKGSDMTPLYGYLTSAKGGEIKWNFTKFLVGENGEVIARFEPKVTPQDPQLVAAVEKALSR